jgi:hypothetical protein
MQVKRIRIMLFFVKIQDKNYLLTTSLERRNDQYLAVEKFKTTMKGISAV